MSPRFSKKRAWPGILAIMFLAALWSAISFPGADPETIVSANHTRADELNIANNANSETLAGASPAHHPDVAESTVDDADVIVVGAGISGLATALDLGRGGAKVMVVDMASVFGGHAVMSQGSTSIVGTPAQEAAGIHDSPDLAYQDFHTWGEDPNSEWVRYYVDHSRTEIYDWLMELGVKFSDIVASSGNTVAREHQPVGRGIGLVSPIYRACLELDNIQFQWNVKVEQLLTKSKRVVGVRIRNLRDGKETELRGHGVVLATGGFQNNLDMVREYWPAEFRFPDRVLVGSGTNSVGSGHRMAQAVGGELFHMDHQWNYYSGLPDPRHPGTNRGLNVTNLYGILVNSEGQRFANDLGWAKEVMPLLLKEKRATVWAVFDEASKHQLTVSGSDWGEFKRVDQLILQNPELVRTAQTLEDLAPLVGLPAANLVATVARYNRLVDQGVDIDFGRFGPGKPEFSNRASPKIIQPPFYAMQTWPLTRKSMGGVATDLQSQVLDKHKRPIPGLFAVGELAGLAGVNGKAALEGTFLGPCIVTGRVAARALLQELSEQRTLSRAEKTSCLECHDMSQLSAPPKEGYWHYTQVHRAIADRGLDCRHCHGELAPWRENDHHMNRQSLTASCILCHVAQE
ncbi:MAG: FAD-dependent oxidoreductase [Planctomycetaceae bacterium]